MGNSPLRSEYAYPVPGTGGNGETAHYRSVICKEQFNGELIESLPWADVKTCHDAFVRAVKANPKSPCLGVRKLLADGKTRGEYVWETYTSIFNRVRDLASGLKSFDYPRGTKIGIYSINRPEWIIVTQACYAMGWIPTPLYDTLGPEAVAFVVSQAEIPVIICSGDKIEKFAGPELAKMETLKRIVSMDPTDKTVEGIEVTQWDDVLKLGAEKKIGFDPVAPEDLMTICYTSGTTGDPKGVMLTHKNMVAMMAGAAHAISIVPTDVHVSYLPLAHMYERTIAETLISFGAAIGFYAGDILKLMDDIQTLKPTVFASVPRLFNRMYDKINQTIAQESDLKRSIFEAGFNSKKEKLKAGDGVESFFWDTVVFRKTKERLGGRVRCIFSGSAPLQSDIHDFLKITFATPVRQGYGLTETTGVSHAQWSEDPTSGNVGGPLPCIEFKLVDVPDMNYFAKDVKGEICLRGPNIFKGYYKAQDKTDEVLTKDGWFHTGDIGQILPNGTLAIVDRKKNIFKLSQGEYVAAEKIENTYLTCKWVQQVFVYGDSTQSALVAVVVPDAEVLKPWAAQNNIDHADDLAALCKNDQVKQMILNDMTKDGKAAKLRGFEFVKAIHLEPTPFSIENDLLTPTFKLKRPQLKNHYTQTIADMYTEVNAQAPSPSQ